MESLRSLEFMRKSGVFRPDNLISCKDIVFSGIPDFFKIMAVVIAVESEGDVLVPGQGVASLTVGMCVSVSADNSSVFNGKWRFERGAFCPMGNGARLGFSWNLEGLRGMACQGEVLNLSGLTWWMVG
jgi:hypothetical protein